MQCFVFVDWISFTSVKFAFNVITVVVELKSYSIVVVKTSYVETPFSNINIKSCVLLQFNDICDPINTTGMLTWKLNFTLVKSLLCSFWCK